MRMLDLFVAFVAWVLCATASAADCPFPDVGSPGSVANYTAVLMRLKQSDCLGDSKADKAPLVTAFNGQTEKPINLGQAERLISAVDLLRDFAGKRAAAGTDADKWKNLTIELGDVRRKLTGLGDVSSMVEFQHIVQGAITSKWANIAAGDADVQISWGGLSVKPLAAPDCRPPTPCPAFDSQLDMVRVANLMARLERYSQDPTLAQHLIDAKLAVARWEAYHTQGQHQYIWEVWLNGQLMGDDLCPKDAGTGMRMGFCKVPTSQWIVLHPDAGLRWTNSANKSSELKPALVVEALGYYRWDWKGSDSAQMTRRRGVSLAAVYTDTSSEKRWSYGPMFHFEDYNLAFTKASGGHWSLVVNINLAERYFGRKQEFTNELQKIKKADLGELLFGQ